MLRHDPWAVPLKPRPDPQVRLFCFPHAGAGASLFRSWPDLLPADIEVHGVQLPGRPGRLNEPLCRRIEAITVAVAEVVTKFSNVRFAFFGHSLGALISFEVARELRRRSVMGPAHLFVSSHAAPSLKPRLRLLHALGDDALLAALASHIGMFDTALANPDLRELLLPVVRADLALSETYGYSIEPPLNCSISAYGGSRDWQVRPYELAAWRSETSRSFEVRLFRGGHFYLSQHPEPLVGAVKDRLSANDVDG